MKLSQLDAYVLTLGVETLVALACAPFAHVRRREAALAAAAGSAVTHPVLWASVPFLRPVFAALTVPFLEGLVIVAEALFYRHLAEASWRAAIILSALANAASWGLGVLLYALM